MSAKTDNGGDVRTALVASEHFYGLSRKLLDDIDSKRIPMSIEFVGAISASATNMALAVELLLKAAALTYGGIPKREHDLIVLFDQLPDHVRKDIEGRYDAFPVPADGVTTSFALDVFGSTPVAKEHGGAGSRVSEPRDDSLRAVLAHVKDAFVTWRYLHEKGDPKKVVRVEYPFHHLGLVRDSVREHLYAHYFGHELRDEINPK